MKKPLLFPLAVALIVAAAYVAATYWMAKGAPAHLATHFDLNGKPNGWMTNHAFVSFSLMLGLGTQIFVSGIVFLTRYLPARLLNVPNRDHWHQPENYRTACNKMFGLSLWLGSLMALWMTLLNYQIVECNKLMPPKLDTQAFLMAMGTFVVMLTAWMIVTWREFKLPAGAPKPKKTKR